MDERHQCITCNNCVLTNRFHGSAFCATWQKTIYNIYDYGAKECWDKIPNEKDAAERFTRKTGLVELIKKIAKGGGGVSET